MKTLASCLLTVLFALNVNAQEENRVPAADSTVAPQSTPTAPATAPAAPARSYDDDGPSGKSARNREGKSVLLTATPIGLGPVTLVSQGLSAGLYVNPDAIVQLDFLANADDDYDGSNYDTKIRSLGLFFKQFLGNSFYIKPGFEYRWIHHSYNYSGLNSESWGFKANTLGVSLAIGNQWQFRGFTMGCDWFGVSQTFTRDTTEEYYVNAPSSTYAQRQLEEDKDDYIDRVNFKFVHFYLGASF
jgi:hypothetical protein